MTTPLEASGITVPALVTGFEGGHTGANAPTDGHIVVDTTSKRTGTYGLHVSAATSTKSTLRFVGIDNTTPGEQFMSLYFKIVTLPSTAGRIILSTATTIGATDPGLYLHTDGKLSLESSASGQGVGTVYWTGAIAYNDGNWHQLEYHVERANDVVRIRIDGVMVCDWTGIGLSGTVDGLVVGAIDTIAGGAFEMYWDDIMIDVGGWPGPGEVQRLDVTGAGDLTDNTNFTVTGAATKWQALTSIDDATSYVSVAAVANAIESYTFAHVSSGKVRALQIAARVRPNFATQPTIILGYRTSNRNKISAGRGLGTGTPGSWTYAFYVGGGSTANVTPLNGLWSNARVNRSNVLMMAEISRSFDVSALYVEAYVDTRTNAPENASRILVDGFEQQNLGDYSVTGTAAISTALARTGAACLRCNPVGDTASSIATLAAFTSQEAFIRAYVYVTAYPTSTGKWRIFSLGSGHVVMASNGSVQLADASLIGSASAAGTIPLGVWTKVDLRVTFESSFGAGNGEMEVLVNDVSIQTATGRSPGPNGQVPRIGSGIGPGTGGADVAYDDVVVDDTAFVPASRVTNLVPTGMGTQLTGSGYGVTGAAAQWQALDESPANDDTDYVTTGTTVGDRQSYAVSTLPAGAQPRSLTTIVRAKRDGASNGNVSVGPVIHGFNAGTNASAAGASYGMARRLFLRIQFAGQLTAALLTAMEFEVNNQSVNSSRLTMAEMIVEYEEVVASGLRSFVVMAG